MAEKEAEKTPAPAAEEKPEAKVEIQLEEFYPEIHLKDGVVFLKRASGKSRWRKIEVKGKHGKLFHYDGKDWQRKTAQTAKGSKRFHDFKWHLRNNWEKVEKFSPPARPAPKPKAAAAEGEAPAA